MGDAHEVIVDHIGEVVGGKPVALEQHVVVERIVRSGDCAKHRILEYGGTALRDLLTNHIGDPGPELLFHLFLGEAAAVPVIFRRHLGGLLHQTQLIEPLLVAEAVVGGSLFDQLERILFVDLLAFALHIGSHRTADVGPLSVDETGFGQRLIDNINGALHLALLIGILNAEDKSAAVFFCQQIGIKRSAQISNMHVAGGAGSKTGTNRAHCAHPF